MAGDYAGRAGGGGAVVAGGGVGVDRERLYNVFTRGGGDWAIPEKTDDRTALWLSIYGYLLLIWVGIILFRDALKCGYSFKYGVVTLSAGPLAAACLAWPLTLVIQAAATAVLITGGEYVARTKGLAPLSLRWLTGSIIGAVCGCGMSCLLAAITVRDVLSVIEVWLGITVLLVVARLIAGWVVRWRAAAMLAQERAMLMRSGRRGGATKL